MLTCLLMALTITTQINAQSTYKLDVGHTLIEFNVERFMVGEVTGKFKSYDGKVVLSDDEVISSATLKIETNSLDTDHEVRDGHLKSAIWLDVENSPEITFESSRVWKDGDQDYIEGQLTIRGTTQTVQFPFEMKGPFKDPTGAMTIGISGDLIIDRQDYGIVFSKLMDNGELFIGNQVRIRIRALAAAQ